MEEITVSEPKAPPPTTQPQRDSNGQFLPGNTTGFVDGNQAALGVGHGRRPNLARELERSLLMVAQPHPDQGIPERKDTFVTMAELAYLRLWEALSSTDPELRLTAARIVVERSFGKPRQQVEVTKDGQYTIVIK